MTSTSDKSTDLITFLWTYYLRLLKNNNTFFKDNIKTTNINLEYLQAKQIHFIWINFHV